MTTLTHGSRGFVLAALLGFISHATPGGRMAAATEAAVPLAAAFFRDHCIGCHEAADPAGGLDLAALAADLSDDETFRTWVAIHDRVARGEMPPDEPLDPEAKARFLDEVSRQLTAHEAGAIASSGRAVRRRMNRYEYEHALRDLLGAPWLQVKQVLPEDGELHRSNKVGEALSVSHVQMARTMQAAEGALRQILARDQVEPSPVDRRYYVREQEGFVKLFKFKEITASPDRSTIPLLGTEVDLEVLENGRPPFAGDEDPERRDREAAGVIASSYEPLQPKFDGFRAPASGRYRLSFKTYTFWVGTRKMGRYWTGDRRQAGPGRRAEPVAVYAVTRTGEFRKLGQFDAQIEPTEAVLDVDLIADETIMPDPVRLFRSRPMVVAGGWTNPLGTADGAPGVAYQWMHVAGPLRDDGQPSPHERLFGELPRRLNEQGDAWEFHSSSPRHDARRLIERFLGQAYRRPATAAETDGFLGLVEEALRTGSTFTDAMLAGYVAILCSPGFMYLEEPVGPLPDGAIASRLSFFLWNSPPDEELRRVAAAGRLADRAVLAAQVDRLLDDPRSDRFVAAFLDSWLDLREVRDTAPDENLYPDYYLDDFLVESAVDETRAYFRHLVAEDLPARCIADSDFVFVNERLAEHYGIPGVSGVALRKVAVPAGNPRGGLLTQAAILKVTANGTTTSPVVRGGWMMERILGEPPPPPPKNVPAIESDTRGARTIREQLDLHRAEESCRACHQKIDPVGFALENFDVLGGWRERYRAIDEAVDPAPGVGHNGHWFKFHEAQPVDASGDLPGPGGEFRDVVELKRILVERDRDLARNLARQLLIHATGAGPRFSDRPHVEAILDRTASRGYGARSLIHAIVASPLFLTK